MCYSARVIAAWKEFVRNSGIAIDIHEFYRVFFAWAKGDQSIRLPKSIVDAFDRSEGDESAAIVDLVEKRKATDGRELQEELFAQRKRLADAERSLKTKTTKAATESARIAKNRIAAAKRRLDDLNRKKPDDGDGRIFPCWYAPVIVAEGDRRIVRPMRYQCRPAGKPAFYDTKYPGTYNARRDSLPGFWKDQFGKTDGIAIITAFYKHVEMEGKKTILRFTPDDGLPMFIACLWSRWTAPGESDLLSFAAVTDDPPPEVAAAGHDRCIIPLTPDGVEVWLHPERHDRKALDAALDEHRVRPFYEHRRAA